MDGRVLCVEWSDSRMIADMFSTVLFVDRISKENTNLWHLFASGKELYAQQTEVFLGVVTTGYSKWTKISSGVKGVYCKKAHV